MHLRRRHVFGRRRLRGGRVVPLEYVEHGLRVVLLLLLADVGGHEQPRPRLRHALRTTIVQSNWGRVKLK